MAETKKITTLYVVTDSETSYDNIGDIDGGLFPDGFLEKHIKSHGAEGLLEKLSYMISDVIQTKRQIIREESEGESRNVASV